MKKNLDNRELNIINRFLHGDHEAYSLLYKEHVQELFSYGKALTSNDERLKDAIQDVFYKILSNPSSLKNVLKNCDAKRIESVVLANAHSVFDLR